MSILKSTKSPTGIDLSFHLVYRFEWWHSATDIGVELRSWPTEEAWADGSPPAFVWPRISVDPAALTLGGLGAAVEGLLVQTPQSPFFGGVVRAEAPTQLQKLQNQKWAAMKLERDRQVAAPLETAHGPIQAGAADRLNIMIASAGAIAAQQLGEPDSTMVVLADNTTVTLTVGELAAVALQFRQRDQSVRARCQQLRAWLFDPRATLESVLALTWETSDEPVWGAFGEGQAVELPESPAAAPVLPPV